MSDPDAPIVFTRTEVLSALQIIMPRAEAEVFLDSIERERDETQGLAWSNDTLALLSLLGDDFRERVEVYRRELRHGVSDPASDRAFQRRREELRQGLK